MTETAPTPPLSDADAARIRELDLVLAVLDRERANPEDASAATPWPLFIRKMRMLTAQAYGPRLERYFAAAFNWSRVPAKANRGDIVDAAGGHYEVKSTIITSSNPTANFVQLRPHQDIAGYHLFIVDTEYKVTHLTVSKTAMAAEIAQLGSSAHGTKAAVAGNTTREYAIRFPWTPESGIAAEWIAKYSAPMPPAGHPLAGYMARSTAAATR